MSDDDLIDRLPRVRGRLTAHAPLAEFTWFRVGGPADVLFRPEDADDLATFLAGVPAGVSVTVIGVGSNLLIRDGGVRGIVIRLGRGFAGIERHGETRLVVGAGALDTAVAKRAAEAGLAGLEFLRGVPGTIGGAVTMNAGAYGRELKDVLVTADLVLADGTRRSMTPTDLGMTYRDGHLPAGAVVVGATLAGRPDDPAVIAGRMAEITAARAETQPVKSRTGGSTFKNPPGHKAWQLIDRAGCRGLRIGDAQVSELHCNFLINLGAATASDIEALGEQVRHRVKEASGIDLHWEIRRIGEAAASVPKGEKC